jgi:hypothetical protein
MLTRMHRIVSLCRTLLAVASCFSLSVCCLGQPQLEQSSGSEALLKRFLQRNLSSRLGEDRTTRYVAVPFDLRVDGQLEFIVYVVGSSWCGSGGCRLMVLEPKAASFAVLAATTITRPPIRVLSTKSNGWHDISVEVAGGGILADYQAKLSFNGRKYPDDPTVPPAQPLASGTLGKEVILSNSKLSPLYR